MSRKYSQEELEKQLEFLQRLRKNELSTPNEFTILMGELIREAREESGLSQAELAKRINKRQGTISDIENGKSEIGVLTLVQFALEFKKPVSYFFPKSILLDFVQDVKSKFQHEVLDRAQLIEMIGNTKLTINMLDLLTEYFEEEIDKVEHPENYLDEEAE